jgi:hypothetical protein
MLKVFSVMFGRSLRPCGVVLVSLLAMACKDTVSIDTAVTDEREPGMISDEDSDGHDTFDAAESIDADGDSFDVNEDCDDEDPDINPGASEICDDIDNDCDGVIDEDAVNVSSWYADNDGDGYGNIDDRIESCDAPAGYVASNGDCDDTDNTRNIECYKDSDGDGYDWNQDCDDNDTSIYPGADEYCNGVDDDCDGVIDNSGAVDGVTWYEDSDGDGYGDPNSYEVECTQPDDRYVKNGADCDDSDPDVHDTCQDISLDDAESTPDDGGR